RLGAPQDDPSLTVDAHGRHVHDIQQPSRVLRGSLTVRTGSVAAQVVGTHVPAAFLSTGPAWTPRGPRLSCRFIPLCRRPASTTGRSGPNGTTGLLRCVVGPRNAVPAP